jgi:hypothetical protein
MFIVEHSDVKIDDIIFGTFIVCMNSLLSKFRGWSFEFIFIFQISMGPQ